MQATAKAVAAVVAAKHMNAWGVYAATRFAMKHGALRHFDIATSFERRRVSK